MLDTARVTVVVPLQDEEATVELLLRSLAVQTRMPRAIVLVNAGSTDRTAERIASLPLPVPVTVISASRVFPGTARNIGVEHTHTDWIAFTDGGITLHPAWLQELTGAVGEETDAVFGNVEPVCDTFFRECAAIAYVPPKDQERTRGPSVASMLIRRSTFERVGGFPPFRAAEDLIFLSRLQSLGAHVQFACRAEVDWQITAGFRPTFERFANYSHHNLIAGWAWHWHVGLARLYLLLALLIAVAHLTRLGSLAWAALPLFFVARATKAAWLKRASFGFHTLSASRVAGAAAVLATIDAATLVGFLRWLWCRCANAGHERL